MSRRRSQGARIGLAADKVWNSCRYYYYFMTAAGYKIWWKKYLTTLQIVQFIIDLFIVYFACQSTDDSGNTTVRADRA